jgi:hypothetical protein
VLLDELNQSFKTTEPFRIGGGGGPEGRFHGLIDDVRVDNVALSEPDIKVISTPHRIDEILAVPPDQRVAAQARKLGKYFLEERAPEAIRAARQDVEGLRQERDRLLENVPTTMVMEECQSPRDTFVLTRGEYNRPGERVTPGVPACLTAADAHKVKNRLDFAKWLVDPTNPLTARVAANRLWQMFFGTGLVKTVDDFGAQGEWPTHPELLDWLASELIRSGWDFQAIERIIVTSATYRQSSKANSTALQKDPENRLLARGPRFRLAAEMIRDQALAVSGLLTEHLGGPSVHPYQPEGLWKDLAEIKEYPQDHGPDLYRRSLYTFWKRTVAPPTMMTFDAAGREACTVRETRTNTPLQALTLMNDVTFVEAARVLAQRVLKEATATPEARITMAFRLATGRRPSPRELEILVASLQQYLVRYQNDRTAAEELTRSGEAPLDTSIDQRELAAYTAVASLILNLDETLTKE